MKNLIVGMLESIKTDVNKKDVVGSLLVKDHLLLGVSIKQVLILVELLISLLLLNHSPLITITLCTNISWPTSISKEKVES